MVTSSTKTIIPVIQFQNPFTHPTDDQRTKGTKDPNFSAAYSAYQQKNYAEAIELFKAINPPSDRSLFYLAQSYFNNGDYVAAAENYKKIWAMKDTSYKQEAEWNLLITLLTIDNKNEEALMMLSRVESDERHSFYRQAKELSKKLKTQQ